MNFSEYRAQIASGTPMLHIAVPKEARGIQGMRAGFFTRLIAVGIDIGVVALVILVLNGLIALINLILDRVSDVSLPQVAAEVAVGTVLLWGSWTLGWWASGRSFGNYVMGLRVVDRHGNDLPLPLAALRAVFCLGFPFGLLWVLVSRENRSVQDLVLRTSVINDWVMGLPTLGRKSRNPASSASPASSD